MLRRLLTFLVLVPLGALLVALAVVNRKPVTFILNPLDASSGVGIEAPFFLFLLGAFAVGLLVGGVATWYGQGKWRAKARKERARNQGAARSGRAAGKGARRRRAKSGPARLPAE